MSSWLKELHLPLEGDERRGIRQYSIYNGSTRCMDYFSSHMSILSSGITPHEPHSHQEEELLIIMSGEAEIVIVDPERGHIEKRERIGLGNFVYYPAFQSHTIHNNGTEPVTYLMFKWLAKERLIVGAQLNTAVFHYKKNATQIRSGSADGIIQNLIFDSSTGYLPKLHSHITNLQSGAGYPPHADAHDVAILLLEGTVETLGQRVESQGLIFYTAGEPHGMKNVGNTMASYLVFEFHGNADRLIDSLLNENQILADELKVAVTELELLKAGMRNSLALQFARKIPYGNQLRKFLKRAFR